MHQYQEVHNKPEVHQIRTLDFIDKKNGWGMPHEPVLIESRKGFMDYFDEQTEFFGETFDYYHPIVHDTLLNQYLHQLLQGKNLTTKSKDRSVAHKYTKVISEGKLKDNSRMLHKFSDNRNKYEIDALLYLRHEGYQYVIMIDFKSNGRDRKDIERFRETNLYKNFLKNGTVYTVAAQPRYIEEPCDNSGDLTEYYLPDNIVGFIEDVKLETVKVKRKRATFNRNIDHKRQKFGPAFN
ncbi:MAG: hypothetical protein GOU98_02450 [Candidatus Altiarchaeota archaeon]|nr:hypothetical protein [Candidatus Altiarchaeota archaeon]